MNKEKKVLRTWSSLKLAHILLCTVLSATAKSLHSLNRFSSQRIGRLSQRKGSQSPVHLVSPVIFLPPTEKLSA